MQNVAMRTCKKTPGSAGVVLSAVGRIGLGESGPVLVRRVRLPEIRFHDTSS